MELNRDLLVARRRTVVPASTQMAVFVSMDIGTLFDLDSVAAQARRLGGDKLSLTPNARRRPCIARRTTPLYRKSEGGQATKLVAGVHREGNPDGATIGAARR